MASSVSLKDLSVFHTIDRQIYEKLVIKLGVDSNISKKVVAFWYLLETKGYTNFIYNMLMLSDSHLYGMTMDAIICLDSWSKNCHNSWNLSLPFMRFIVSQDFCLAEAFQDRENCLRLMGTFLNDVCDRVFIDFNPKNLVNELQIQPVTANGLSVANGYGLPVANGYGLSNGYGLPVANGNRSSVANGVSVANCYGVSAANGGLSVANANGNGLSVANGNGNGLSVANGHSNSSSTINGSGLSVSDGIGLSVANGNGLSVANGHVIRSSTINGSGLSVADSYGLSVANGNGLSAANGNGYSVANGGVPRETQKVQSCRAAMEAEKKDVAVASNTDRTLFITFSKGHPISKEELRDLIVRKFGNCVESVYMRSEPEPLFARVVIDSVSGMSRILGDKDIVKLGIHGKDVWVRRFIQNTQQVS